MEVGRKGRSSDVDGACFDTLRVSCMDIVIIEEAVTPPVGATAYVVAGMAGNISLNDVFRGVTYFLPAYILCVILLMLFPKVVLFLPGLLN
jgi:TRAP-type C4-dicarboxylate transport system permease large subunit